MGLCASRLPWLANRGQPEPRHGMPNALFVVRNNGRPSKAEALVFHPHRYGCSRLQKPGRTDSKRHQKCGCDCTDVSRMLRAPKASRLPCGSTRSAAVEPMAAAEIRPPVSRGARADGRAATTAAEGCRTPMTPRRTPLWQRRILMGTRCELPRFSGLILYDEHGQPLQSSSQNRAGHLISRASKHESKGKKGTARTTTTLRDLL
ncbi:unnamed protein product [Urochloa decumbens]|uniref:Uncharacterized protein n=1 Tax=Urochloa decumbens TaxID=240449 RepID=A0ABC9EGF1_9POAL